MANIKFNSVSKKFGDVLALDNINLNFKDGEFISLLGPSGCGKTTLLRTLAGFEQVSDGEVYIDDKLVSSNTLHILPEKRNIGMVFQAYALWPHMSVWDNVAFGLKIQKKSKSFIDKQVKEALEVVGLMNYSGRKPSELSGGQKQRVALARCMAMSPSLILFDEPLANLDLNLRESMLHEFRNFHNKLKCTMVYVTHDQNEAMALADKIVVMNKGRVLQVGKPENIYYNPKSIDVATFIGKGMVVDGIVLKDLGEKAEVDIFGKSFIVSHNKQNLISKKRVKIALKSEFLQICKDGVNLKVVSSLYQGSHRSVLLQDNSNNAKFRLNHFDESLKEGKIVQVCIKDGWII